MLEILLAQYKMQFGIDFPLKNFEGQPEIDVINIVYECLYSGKPYEDGMKVPENRFPTAPTSKK